MLIDVDEIVPATSATSAAWLPTRAGRMRQAWPDTVSVQSRGQVSAGSGSPRLRAESLAELGRQQAASHAAGRDQKGPGDAGRRTSLRKETLLASVGVTWTGGVVVVEVPGGGESWTRRVRVARAWSRYTGRPCELFEPNPIVLDPLESEQRRREDHGYRIEGRARIHDGASIRSNVTVAPVVIGDEAGIATADTGPHTSVGAHARVEGAAMAGSIVSAGATAAHVECQLLAGAIGQNPRIFRDFLVPRAIRLRVVAGAEVAVC